MKSELMSWLQGEVAGEIEDYVFESYGLRANGVSGTITENPQSYV